MSGILYQIIIEPLKMIFDWIFCFALQVQPYGICGAIVILSLCVSILTLPLYNMSEKIQAEERQAVKKMEKWTLHIKKTFRGNEKFMMLSEWYRQNNYNPIYALRSTLSILIQIPFFIAAFHYLHESELLKGASFFIFKDLSLPDALLSLKLNSTAISINILPFVMTAINIISGSFYAKDLTLREKLQMYMLSAVFLVLLYKSPSGLVIYWTLNNLFSLAKNIFKKNKRATIFLVSVFLIIFVHFISVKHFGYKKKMLIIFAYLLFFSSIFAKNLILLGKFLIAKLKLTFTKFRSRFIPNIKITSSPNIRLLVLSGISLAILCGLLLPASVIATSPIEFSFLGKTDSPLFYVKTSFCAFLGLLVFWPIILYYLSGNKFRLIFPILLFTLSVCAIFNVYIFKCDYGNLSVSFSISNPNKLNVENMPFRLVPLELFALLLAVSLLLCNRGKSEILTALIFAVSLGMAAFSLTKIKAIKAEFANYEENLEKYGRKEFWKGGIEPVYHLSKTQKNVVVLFLDRGVGPFVKGIFEEFPEIKEKFDGFTYFSNTVSFSHSTVTGSLPLYGGYEYTQEEINKRDTELLRDKNNEAQLLMPKLFLDAGFSATVTDPCWPNFKWSGDLSAYEKFPEIVAKELEGNLYENFIMEKGLTDYNDADSICKKQIANFSLLQVLYPNLRRSFYEQTRIPLARKGISGGAKDWLWKFSHLYYLPLYTDFDADKGAFINMHSMAAHDVFTPSEDLEMPAAENLKDWNGRSHFLADAACFRQYGKFFDLLKENGCYDNTRIIIVSDHGWDGGELKGRFYEFENPQPYVAMWMTAMLLVKDFDSHGDVKSDDTFMTNADTLYLAKEGLGLSDTNPFTGKKLVPQKDDGVNVYWCYDWNAVNFQEATQFQLTENLNYHVSGDIYNENNWIPLNQWKMQQGKQK